MINGDIIMAATTVAPAEEQTHGAPLTALGFEGQCNTVASVLLI